MKNYIFEKRKNQCARTTELALASNHFKIGVLVAEESETSRRCR